MSRLCLHGISKRFGSHQALDSLTIAVEPGELFSILGPSGCGKTTALRIVAGFLDPDSGQVVLGDLDLTRLPPEQRHAAMVFQSYALFPHLDVGENVAFGLRARGAARGPIAGRVAEALELVGLRGYERRAVGDLSGGEQQRVALARALVVEPKLLLLDEPMSNLDPKLREGTRRDLRALQRRLGITTLYVTHDQQEALEVSDRVAIMSNGTLVQVGPPRELYDAPHTEFVATFLGHANVIRAVLRDIEGGRATLVLGDGRLLGVEWPAHARAGQSVLVAVRPESIRVIHPTDSAGLAVLGEGVLASSELQGPTIEWALALPGLASPLRVLTLNDGKAPPPVGSRILLGVAPERVIVLSG